MEKRQLGNSGIQVAPLALGTNVFGWTIDEQQSFRILDAFVEAGLNLVDTADMYSRWAAGNKGGESETIIGNWLKKSGKRNKIVLATKVGADMGDGNKGLSKAYILKAVEDSLKRLQTDHIDLYQSHFDDGITPVEETIEAYTQLVKEGKVKAVGASNLIPERLKASLDASRQHGYAIYTKPCSHITTCMTGRIMSRTMSLYAWKTGWALSVTFHWPAVSSLANIALKLIFPKALEAAA